MALPAHSGLAEAAPGDGPFVRFPFRRYLPAAPGRRLGFTVSLAPDLPMKLPGFGLQDLEAAAAFLVDSAHDLVPATTLARMIGTYCLAASGGGERGRAMAVTLAGTDGSRAVARVASGYESERTGFGAAHILYEDATLGLYILEIAPGRAIPAHSHQRMHEFELILDDGLLQQEQPVARGNAYAWPLGHVHAYRNPTGKPKRILCIDSPSFMPEDEVPLAGRPRLSLLAPLANYLA